MEREKKLSLSFLDPQQIPFVHRLEATRMSRMLSSSAMDRLAFRWFKLRRETYGIEISTFNLTLELSIRMVFCLRHR
jgi:hypothetical protein